MKLYGNGAYGIKTWEIWSEDDTIHIFANGGRYQETVTPSKGKTLEQQVKQRMDARIRNKLASGFKATKEELVGGNTNQLGFVMPMLATHEKDVKHINWNKVWTQPKLDGHRCLMNRELAYTRGGKEIMTIPEIQESINVPEGLTLDGELYCHGFPLQTIASWAKRRQPNTLKLQYHIYDVIGTEMNFRDRFKLLQGIVKPQQYIRLVDTRIYDKTMSLDDHYASYRREGYEGGILRLTDAKYEAGKRSKSLLKVKRRFDAEFECVDVISDRINNGILICKSEGGHFKTVAPGNHSQKAETLRNKEKYIGKFVTCEYAELSLNKVPQHCVAIRWRNDL